MDSLQEALDVLDRFVAAFSQQQQVNEALSRAIDGLDALDTRRADDIAELREGLAALSSRIESGMQLLAAYVADGPAGESVRVLRQP